MATFKSNDARVIAGLSSKTCAPQKQIREKNLTILLSAQVYP
jgi:hypothetical protein